MTLSTVGGRAKLARGSVLIVDDDPQWGAIVRRKLEGEGFQCDIAADYFAAMEMLTKPSVSVDPEALVLDLSLQEEASPPYEGWELAAAARRKQIGTVIVTAHAKEEYLARKAFRDFGVRDFIDKSNRSQVNSLAVSVAEAIEVTRRLRAQRKAVAAGGPSELQIQFEVVWGQGRLRGSSRTLGEPRADFDGLALGALESVLASIQEGRVTFDRVDSETIALLKLDSLKADEQDFLTQVGVRLYRCLAVGEMASALVSLVNQAMGVLNPATLQLRYDEDAGTVAQHPWELIHDGRAHLAQNYLHVVRSVSSAVVAPRFNAEFPLKVLYVAPRPLGMAPLTNEEQQSVAAFMRREERTREYELEVLPGPVTYDQMLRRLEANREVRPYHVLYFDGHGRYGWCCPSCRWVNDPEEPKCANPAGCENPRGKATLEGYLIFEDEGRSRHAISASRFASALATSRVQIAILSACDSAKVRSGTLNNALAPALVARMTPVVLAMQFPIPAAESSTFFTEFFRSLESSEGLTLPAIRQAVYAARKRMQSDKWFYPVLYVRAYEEDLSKG